jgi:hypothetical protein
VIVVGGLPVHHYRAEEAVAEAGPTESAPGVLGPGVRRDAGRHLRFERMARSTEPLQAEAGYIDARPQRRQIDEILLRRTGGQLCRFDGVYAVSGPPPTGSQFRRAALSPCGRRLQPLVQVRPAATSGEPAVPRL